MTEAAIPEVSGCIPKVLDSWRSLFSVLNIGHQIYPSEAAISKDCEFIIIDSKIQIRVIHVSPTNVHKSYLIPKPLHFDNGNSKRFSLSEEYWFTKWNKPLKIGNCNCSFRRSVRYSIISNQPASVQNSEKNKDNKLNVDAPPIKITNVESFVERLVQDTFFEAFHEFYISKTKVFGESNFGYETTEIDDVVVTLRKKMKPNQIIGSIRNSNDLPVIRASSCSTHSWKISCVHQKVQNKPLIMMFHGIGASADIWSLVINTLVCKGYEVIAPDMLGHGFSSAPTKSSYYTFKSLLLQALTIFDHYMSNEKRKCIMIGHSYGCSLVTAMYPHRAQQIAQLILISGGGPTPLAPPVKDNEISPFGCAYSLLNPLLYCGLKRSFFYSSRGKHFKVCDDEHGLPRHVVENIAIGQRWPEGDAAFHRRILAPTLLIHGLQDKHVTLVQECEIERTIPRAFLELIPDAGHLSMIETPEHLIHMIICFLDMWS